MKVRDHLHETLIYGRRIDRLAGHFAGHLPRDARVLDVGCGDGLLARRILELRPDLAIDGIDVLVRESTHIPVKPYDGRVFPCADDSYDVVTFVDVLHHVDDPSALLEEAARVGKRAVVVKDHLLAGPLAGSILRIMDRVGNARYGVALPYNYWPLQRWRRTFASLGLRPVVWKTDLGLYCRPLTWVFERSLHFFAHLDATATGRAHG